MKLYSSLVAYFISLFWLITFSSAIANESDEYTVDLSGSTSLHPTVLMPPILSNNPQCTPEYGSTIFSIFSFDMKMNGMMAVLDEKEVAKVKKILASNPDSFPLQDMKAFPLSYLLSSTIDTNGFSVKVTSIADGVTKSYSPIALSNNIATDRRRIHQLSDFIFKDLFGLNGIASTRILYSKRLPVVVKKGSALPPVLSEIYICDYDGGNSQQLSSMKSVAVTPQWIPNSSDKNGSFLFVSYVLGQPKIYISTVTNPKPFRLSKMRGNQMTPAVSHDGQTAAFACDILGSSDLYMLSFDRKIGEISKPRQVYKTPSCATGCPSFSPDGKTIAFVSNKDGSAKIYILPIPDEKATLKSLRPKLISRRCRENSSPAWSPDGKKIAYNARNGTQERQIWIYDIDHDREYQLTHGSGHKENPSWANDSLHITYQGLDKRGISQIYITNLHDTATIAITSGETSSQFPAWEP